jgi:hypothetical protein
MLEAIKEVEDRLKGYHEQRIRMGALVQARGNTGIQLVGLYKTLAGGWTTETAQETGK